MNSKEPINKKIVTEVGNEFADELGSPLGEVGLSPITGGLITRNLIKEAEQILMSNEKNITK